MFRFLGAKLLHLEQSTKFYLNIRIYSYISYLKRMNFFLDWS